MTVFAGTFFLLIFLLSVEIVLKPALQLLWLPARMLRWLLLELSGQRRRNDASREAKKAEARQRQQAQVQKYLFSQNSHDKTIIICQDRLGTNMMKTDPK